MWQIKEFTLLVTVFLFYPNIECCNNIEDYYWRDYSGIIPSDALPGGLDRSGRPMYIGQILHRNMLLTAKLYLNDNKGYYGATQKEFTGANNIKVLCTQHPDRFEWIETTADDIPKLADRHLIIGGHEPGYTMYIGRAYYKLETAVGKVSTGNPENHGLYVTHEGTESKLKSFEILAYMK